MGLHISAHMLVLQTQAVGAHSLMRIMGGVLVLELGDHALAAAGIARHRIDRQRKAGRDKALAHQWRDQGQKAGRIAAGIGHPGGMGHGVPLSRAQFCKPISPAGRGPVGGRGVDHPHLGAFDQGYRLARRVVRQAQDHHIRIVQRGLTRRGVLAPLAFQRQQLQPLRGWPAAHGFPSPVVPAAPSMKTWVVMVRYLQPPC